LTIFKTSRYDEHYYRYLLTLIMPEFITIFTTRLVLALTISLFRPAI
jgi:hypothetical protein